MKKSVLFSNIEWDTDSEGADLPTEALIQTDVEDIEQHGADILADKYGYLVTSFSFEIQQ